MNARRFAALASVMGAALLTMAGLAPAAGADTPAPGYGQFAGCPSPSENPVITGCVRSVIKGGHFQMGSKDVPITAPMTLSGGLDSSFKTFAANSKGGLTPVKQQVPGGVIGLTGLDWLVNFLDINELKLFAVTELTGPPTKFSFTSLSLPVKVHLVNPVLGSKCYVGSSSNPILLNMITGTTSPPAPNKPITGFPGTPSFDEASGILSIKDSIFVDNSFAAPGASGCTLTLFGFIPFSLNPLVNLQAGLPAAAGTNETKQTVDTEIVPSELVYP